MQISLKVKENIFRYFKLSKAKPFWNETDVNHSKAYEFLSKVWEIDIWLSLDEKYSTAKEEIEAKLDSKIWNYDQVLLERLNILVDTPSFIKFIEAIVSTNFDSTISEQALHLFAINNELEFEKLNLRKEQKTNNYKVSNIKDDDIDKLEFRKARFEFYVIGKSKPIPDDIGNKAEYFILEEYGWDDYYSKTTFNLYYYKGNEFVQSFGEVKIMTKGEKITMDVIPEKFPFIPQKFCSLGQTEHYYLTLYKLFPNEFFTILAALGDCAFYPEKLEAFENHSRFKNSLLRDDSAERILRVIKYKILNYDLTKLFDFSYDFKPAYAENPVEINFKFPANKDSIYGAKKNELISKRIYAVIGKNGTGKTQLLNSLAKNIAANNEKLFKPKTPGFSKLIHVSYSVFDTFKASSISSKAQYVYCGLKDENGDVFDSRRLLLRFHNSWKKIKFQDRMSQWREILGQIIDIELVNEFIVDDYIDFTNRYKVDIPKFHEVKDKMSSGQNILLFIITEIMANIRYDSLILYDEPETHLHPNAITELVNTIYQLVDDFQSFCIIGTHSPIIIQELLSKNVLIMDREENIPSIRKIETESFGENLSKLTEDVFGHREVSKKYKEIIKGQVSNNKSFDEIVYLVTSDEVPLSLNAKLYIASQISVNEKS